MALGEVDLGFKVPHYIGGDFLRALEALEVTYKVLQVESLRNLVGNRVREILKLSEVDLGIEWRDGRFLPAGAPELDEALVNEGLAWLSEAGLPTVREPLDKALRHMVELHRRPELAHDVVTDAYEALEALAKVITGRDKDLSANREIFLSKLGHSGLRGLLGEYIDYAHKNRHAVSGSAARALPTAPEAEAFVYLTALFIRLASRTR